MFNKRTLIELVLIVFLLSIAGFTILEWESLDCKLLLNIWLLLFSMILLCARSLFLVVTLMSNSFSMITCAACLFFFVINPLIILLSLSGISIYIAYLVQHDSCGSFYDVWIFFACLILSSTHMILSILQSIRIYKSMRYLRAMINDPYMQNLISGGLNDSTSFTHEELSRMPSFRATGLTINTDCSICHEKILSEELLRNLPGCTHTFHQNCIDNWLRQNPTCPLCRNNVRLNFL
ncbi:hypothetical protein SteCoe_6121 [Stentor coeruleus]|uniref:RING-type domain-containing protein n=1 Tax=Stentor coeruleus TaxID=5963 RepID=A0A1R2CQP4_9CILI|nr:hypothetical protein SteCoe_6121 [Stentor coeruleus]